MATKRDMAVAIVHVVGTSGHSAFVHFWNRRALAHTHCVWIVVLTELFFANDSIRCPAGLFVWLVRQA